MGQTVVTNPWADQLTDGIEVTFGKGVNIRVIEFLGKVSKYIIQIVTYV